MGLVRAAAGVRRSKNNGLARRSGENKGEYGPGFRASGSEGFVSHADVACLHDSVKASTFLRLGQRLSVTSLK